MIFISSRGLSRAKCQRDGDKFAQADSNEPVFCIRRDRTQPLHDLHA